MIILYTLIPLVLLGCLAAAVHWWRGRQCAQAGEPEEVNTVDMECCGQHEVCEKDSLLAALSREIEYYNDEELDRFRQKSGDDYTAEEAEEFRDVLYTMRNDEVAGWVRSLQLRGINLPDEVKDEVFLIVGERRSTH